MRIGIVGAGMIGSTLAKLWVDAGHHVLVASRHPEESSASHRSTPPAFRKKLMHVTSVDENREDATHARDFLERVVGPAAPCRT